MASQTIENRVDRLEARVTILEQLPERFDQLSLQIVQLRTEMHDEFSAVREELATQIGAVRKELSTESAALRRDLGAQISAVRDELGAQIEESRRHARVLHEDVISRLRTIQEAPGLSQRPSKRKSKRQE